MAEKYSVHIQENNARTGHPLPVPIVSVMRGNRKVCKIYGQNTAQMRAEAGRIAEALVAAPASSPSHGEPAK